MTEPTLDTFCLWVRNPKDDLLWMTGCSDDEGHPYSTYAMRQTCPFCNKRVGEVEGTRE